MAYEGEKSVVPTFRDITVEQKVLGDDDSIEMPGIATNAAVPLYHNIFNENTIRTEIEKVTRDW